MTCPACGAELRAGAKFCPVCGRSLKGEAKTQHTSICPHCQNPISSAMRFCRFCGKSLEDVFCPACRRANRPGTRFCAHCGAQMAAQASEQPVDGLYETGKIPIGLLLAGRYRVLRKIAQGGMGAVYEASEATALGSQRLAIKEMSFSILSRLEPEKQNVVLESFRREFDLLSKLQHPNLVRASDFFEEQGRQFYVMEFIEGQTLEAILDALPPGQFLPVERVLAWARQLCEVLDYLHSQTPQIIYRDLKPSNVMEISGSQSIKLFDFGIARFYKPGQRSDTLRFGTDGYLAPEIIAYHTQTSERTDVYALGALLHQVLTRYDPLMDPWRRPAVRLTNPQVPEVVAQAVERALALNPTQRTPTALAMLKDMFGPEAQIVRDAPQAAVPAPGAAPASAVAPVPEPVTPAQLAPVAEQPTLVAMKVPAEALVSSAPAPPAAIPDHPAGPAASQLDLGSVEKGRVAEGTFQVLLPSAITGQVQSRAPWLRLEPEQLTADTNVKIYARTADLPLERWDAAAPAWFRRLPGFLRGWLALHLNPLVGAPRRHQGLIQVTAPGAPEAQIQVNLEVYPHPWRLGLGWVLAAVLMLFEVSVLLTGMLFVLLLL